MERKMKAALKTTEGTFEIGTAEMPKLSGPDWVLAKIKATGICGTDLRHWKKHEHDLECRIMGHEVSGEVVEVGPAVINLKPGDRVVIETVLGDETCDWCKVQQYNICPHLYPVRMDTVSRSFAAYIAAPEHKMYRLPDHVTYEEATVLDTLSVCLHAIRKSSIKINDKVVVIGAGPIGLGQLQLAKAYGCDVVVTDVVESSLQKAKELGADLVINTKDTDGSDEIMKFTNLRGADIVFECAGGPSMPVTLPQATKYVRRGGEVVIVGGFEEGETSIPLEWQRIQMSEIKLIPSASYAYWDIYPEMQICLDLVAKGKLDAKKMITHSFPLDKINEAFETAHNKEKTGAIFVALTVED